MRHYLFLDIDGVFNLNKKNFFAGEVTEDNIITHGFNQESVFRFVDIVKNVPDIQIVLSGSCRKIDSYYYEVTSYFADLGILFEGRTPSHPSGFRGEEINAFLSTIKGCFLEDYNYAIIDDDSDFYLNQLPFLFQTDPEYGITETIGYRVKYGLINNKWKGI